MSTPKQTERVARLGRRARFAIVLTVCLSLGAAGVFVGCSGVSDIASNLGAGKQIFEGGRAVIDAGKDIPPVEQYNYGRAAMAQLLARPTARPLVSNEALTRYVSRVGHTLVLVCDRPAQYKGWHFAVLDSDEVNAFSAPGGFVVVTRGAVMSCTNEDELASILAHEVAHVERGDPLQALRDAKRNAGLSKVASGAADSSVGGNIPGAGVLASASGVLLDTFDKGFSKGIEEETDKRAVELLARAGYNPEGMVALFGRMKPKEKGGILDRIKNPVSTHYQPGKRAEIVSAHITALKGQGYVFASSTARDARFKKETGL